MNELGAYNSLLLGSALTPCTRMKSGLVFVVLYSLDPRDLRSNNFYGEMPSCVYQLKFLNLL